MTAFATARRRRAEQAVVPQASMPVGLVSHLPGDVASRNLAKGIVRMSKLQTKPRRIVSLPQLPGSVPSRLPATIPAVDVSPFLPSIPLSPVPELTPAEKALIEAEKIQADRATAEKEFDRYIAEGVCEVSGGINLVRAWDVCRFVVLYGLKLTYLIIQMNETKYPLAFLVALDILPVQASSVPGERLFSSSKETCTDRRNRICPKLLEILQMRKYSTKQRRLDFMEGFLAREEDYLIGGELTKRAIDELLALGKLDELEDLLHNASEPSATE